MNYTLNQQEYRQVLDWEFYNNKYGDDTLDYLKEFIEDAKTWNRQVSGLNHILTLIFEKLEKNGENALPIIQFIYDYNNQYNFYIQEGNIQFLDKLINIEFHKELTLEQTLIDAQNAIFRNR